MKVFVIGKENCGVCDSAKRKLELMRIPYTFVDIEKDREVHDGWRVDDTIDALALFSMNNCVIPTIAVGHQVFTYSAAMRYLKKQQTEVRDREADTTKSDE